MINTFHTSTAAAIRRGKSRVVGTLAAAAVAGLAAFAQPAVADAAELKILSSFNSTQKPTFAVLERYIENVGKIGGDTVTFVVSGPEVVPIFEQLQPVSSGVFDALYTHPVFHAGEGGLALTVDAIAVDPIARRASGVWDYVDNFYQQKHGLKMVAMMSVSMYGYHLFTKEPLSDAGDLAGRKVRGTPTYHGVIRALGAEPVVLPGSEIYSALQKGIVDGAGWPAAGMVSMKHYEVANYRLRPTFGAATQPVFINLDSWNGLTNAEKSVLLEAGKLTELEMPWIGNQIQAEEDTRLDELGVEVQQLPADVAAKVQTAFIESIWELGTGCCGEAAAELRGIALKAGLTQ
ncbi:MAG: TRAP transporter substrate-binding protein DctP [Minwuia sp.]|uniref:TRAP transporter substrate-binding protein DctP n=1 Tax=Minwuia sp. TaxID=2493630 RepID=UPI003A83DEA3